MGILSDWGRRRQQRSTIKPQCEYINSDNQPNSGIKWWSRNRISDKSVRYAGLQQSKFLHTNESRRSISIHPDIPRTRYYQPDPHTKSHHNRIRNRHNKRVYAVIAAVLGANTLLPMKAFAESVGGVSATANPIANSSGSVTNQAIQVLQGPYVTNTYGGGVSCQGTTLNMTPYIQFADSRKDPWEDFYNQPQYNMTDVTGRTVQQTVTVQNYPWESWYDDRTKADGTRWFEDGADMTITQDVPAGDGVPDAVQNGEMEPTWYKPVRTDMKANQSFNLGLSATLSIPLNRGMQRRCRAVSYTHLTLPTICSV